MTGSPRLKLSLLELPIYKAGARPDAGTLAFARLASNEVPFAPLPAVLRAVMSAAGELNRYPDPASEVLIAALSRHHDVHEGQIAVGTGSVAIGAQLVQVTAERGDEVVFAWRSFEAYPIFAGLAQAVSVAVPLDSGGRHDLDAMLAAVTSRTRAIFLCSPNNPTGPTITHDDALRFCDRLPEDVLIVIDEAYREFVTAPDAVDGIAIARSRPNVCVLRTFSKAYGLAALRVGYAISSTSVIGALRRTATLFGVNSIAQAAAVESLRASDELLTRVSEIVRERERVREALISARWDVPDAQGNFVWLPTGARTEQFEASARRAGVLVRAYPQQGCRVTVAGPVDNDRFLALAGAASS